MRDSDGECGVERLTFGQLDDSPRGHYRLDGLDNDNRIGRRHLYIYGDEFVGMCVSGKW